MNWNWFDILILILVAVPIVAGARVGLIRTLTSLATVVVGTILALLFWEPAADIVSPYITDDNVAALAGYGLILGVTFLAGWVLTAILKTVLAALLLGWLDKAGGAAFGAVAGVIVVAAATWSLESFTTADIQLAVEMSTLRPYFDFLIPIFEQIAGEVDLSALTLA